MQNNPFLVKVWSIFSPHPFWSCKFLYSIFCITCWKWVSHAGNPEIWLSLFSSLGWASLKNSKMFFWPTSRPPITKLMSYFHKSGSPSSFIFMSCYVDATYFSLFDFSNLRVILFPEHASLQVRWNILCKHWFPLYLLLLFCVCYYSWFFSKNLKTIIKHNIESHSSRLFVLPKFKNSLNPYQIFL